MLSFRRDFDRGNDNNEVDATVHGVLINGECVLNAVEPVHEDPNNVSFRPENSEKDGESEKSTKEERTTQYIPAKGPESRCLNTCV